MSDDNDIAVRVQGLHKDFRLPHERRDSIKERLLNFRRKQSFEKFHVLKDINIEVKRGEFVGIVGRNGSGKSTLLKLIGGIYQPTQGSVQVNGTLTPFIELGIGFNPELTGRQNVFLNGAILGLTHKEVLKKYDSVVEFAELENFMDQKLKNYSSGMQVRLAFSIAMQAHNDVLLIDEVLAVGDSNFQRKCFNVFKDIKKSGKTVIFVTHAMSAVQEYCDRAIMLKDGEVFVEGDTRKVALAYEIENASTQSSGRERVDRPGDPAVKLQSVKVGNGEHIQDHFSAKDDMVFDIELMANKKTDIQMSVNIVRDDGLYVAGFNTTETFKDFQPEKGRHKLRCKIARGQLAPGEYDVDIAVHTRDEPAELIDIIQIGNGGEGKRLSVIERHKAKSGIFDINARWTEE